MVMKRDSQTFTTDSIAPVAAAVLTSIPKEVWCFTLCLFSPCPLVLVES